MLHFLKYKKLLINKEKQLKERWKGTNIPMENMELMLGTLIFISRVNIRNFPCDYIIILVVS